MTKPIPGVAEQALTAADAVFGDGYSAILYGSWARGDVLEGRSDVNLLLVVPGLPSQSLLGLSEVLREFEDQRIAPPLLFTAGEWQRVGDSFPIEITDMQGAYRVLRGADVVAGVRVVPADLRRALEAELWGKLLRLRVDYALYAAHPDLLAAVVGFSVGSIRVLLRGALRLGGLPVPPADGPLAGEAGRVCGFDPAPLSELLARRRQTAWRCQAPLFEAYLGIVEQATRYVDTVQPGVP